MSLLAFDRQVDTVVVDSISRFARNTRDLLELVQQFINRGVEFPSQKGAIDTTIPIGKLMLAIFAAVAALERESIPQRQKEGIAISTNFNKIIQMGIYQIRSSYFP